MAVDENKLRELALCVQAAWDWNNAAETMREHSEAYQAWVKAREALERAANPAAVLSLLETLAALRAERDALVADARRYDWIRRHTGGGRPYVGGVKQFADAVFVLPEPQPVTNIMRGDVGQHFDAAIDQAIAKEPTR